MAIHILEGGNVSHCPIHDLESITYLGLWIAAHIVKRENKNETLASELVLLITGKLRPNSDVKLPQCAVIKLALLKELANQSVDEAKENYHGAFAPFAEILLELVKLGRKWHQISVKHAKASTMFSNDEIEQAFVEYLDVYDKYMPTEESWHYLQSLEIIHV